MKTFYVNIKTIDRVKRQSMFERNKTDFKGK